MPILFVQKYLIIILNFVVSLEVLDVDLELLKPSIKASYYTLEENNFSPDFFFSGAWILGGFVYIKLLSNLNENTSSLDR